MHEYKAVMVLLLRVGQDVNRGFRHLLKDRCSYSGPNTEEFNPQFCTIL